MSTLAYAALTTRHEEATGESPSGVKSYIDAMAALVPAEVLALHALIVSVTTRTSGDDEAGVTTTITEPGTLEAAFWALIVLSVVLFVVPRVKKWKRLDIVRMLLAPAAFIIWCMLQRSTAFDAVASGVADAPRTVFALLAAAVVGIAAAALANKAEQAEATQA
jgi:hypothetical protein